MASEKHKKYCVLAFSPNVLKISTPKDDLSALLLSPPAESRDCE